MSDSDIKNSENVFIQENITGTVPEIRIKQHFFLSEESFKNF